MHLDREPNRSRTPSPPPFDDQNNENNEENDDEIELLTTIAEKESEMKITEDLIIERIRQMETTLNQLRQVNHLLEQFVILEHKTNK